MYIIYIHPQIQPIKNHDYHIILNMNSKKLTLLKEVSEQK